MVGGGLPGAVLPGRASLPAGAGTTEATFLEAPVCGGVSTISAALPDVSDVSLCGAARGQVPPSVAIGDEGRLWGVVCGVLCGVLRSRWALMRGSGIRDRGACATVVEQAAQELCQRRIPAVAWLRARHDGHGLAFCMPATPLVVHSARRNKKTAPQRIRDGLWLSSGTRSLSIRGHAVVQQGGCPPGTAVRRRTSGRATDTVICRGGSRPR
jgi:hypothetical protein